MNYKLIKQNETNIYTLLIGSELDKEEIVGEEKNYLFIDIENLKSDLNSILLEITNVIESNLLKVETLIGFGLGSLIGVQLINSYLFYSVNKIYLGDFVYTSRHLKVEKIKNLDLEYFLKGEEIDISLRSNLIEGIKVIFIKGDLVNIGNIHEFLTQFQETRNKKIEIIDELDF